MNHQLIENEIQHLEHVIAHVSSRDHIPLSYWWTRVNAIDAVALVPSQRVRIERISEILQELDAGSTPS